MSRVHIRVRVLASLLAATGLVAAGTAAAVADNPATTDAVTVEITGPGDGATMPVGTSLDVTGRATVGGSGAIGSVSYVVDLSGSTAGPDGNDCKGTASSATQVTTSTGMDRSGTRWTARSAASSP